LFSEPEAESFFEVAAVLALEPAVSAYLSSFAFQIDYFGD
jgi:hypothetical protein